MFFRRTEPSHTGGPFAFENEVTAWWDGSQIYGSDQATQNRLRTDPGVPGQFLPHGKLYVNSDNTLPLKSESGVIDSGFTRNMWLGLELLHTLFVRHHNYLCEITQGTSHLVERPDLPPCPSRERRHNGEDSHDRMDAGGPSDEGTGSRPEHELARYGRDTPEAVRAPHTARANRSNQSRAGRGVGG